MYCTKCGKKLQDGDRFCANCGAEVRKTDNIESDDVVFNPPFKIEAQRRTEEILKSTEKSEQPKPKQETVDFAWNLDGFPSTQPRKTEEVDFNWGSVVEKRNNARAFSAERADLSDDRAEFSPWAELHMPSVAKVEKPEAKEAEQKIESIAAIPELEELKQQTESTENMSMSIEDLEKELFGLEKEREAEEEKLAEPTIIAKSVDKKKTVPSSMFVSNDIFDEPYYKPVTARQETKPAEAEQDKPEIAEVKQEADVDAFKETEIKQQPVQPVSNEQTSFKGDERFYTYNQKFEAFQKLLEQEKQRIKNLENGFSSEVSEINENKSAVLPETDYIEKISDKEATECVKKAEIKPELEEAKDEISVVFAPVTMAIDMTGSLPESVKEAVVKEKTDTAIAENEKKEVSAVQAPPSNKYADDESRQRKSDIKSGDADNGSVDSSNSAKEIKKIDLFDDIKEDEEPKKFTAAKIIIGILAFLIAAELVILGVKFVAPDSSFSKAADKMMVKAADFVMNIIGGDESDEDDGSDDADLPETDEKFMQTEKLIKEASSEVKTIGEVSYDPELKFSLLKNYSFEEIEGAEQFVDAEWYEDENGTVTYGSVLYETLVKHYDSWKSVNDDENLVGINKLEIGESKTGEKGFYTLCRISFAGADGKEIVKYQTVFQKISEKTMIINETKEDNL